MARTGVKWLGERVKLLLPHWAIRKASRGLAVGIADYRLVIGRDHPVALLLIFRLRRSRYRALANSAAASAPGSTSGRTRPSRLLFFAPAHRTRDNARRGPSRCLPCLYIPCCRQQCTSE